MEAAVKIAVCFHWFITRGSPTIEALTIWGGERDDGAAPTPSIFVAPTFGGERNHNKLVLI